MGHQYRTNGRRQVWFDCLYEDWKSLHSRRRVCREIRQMASEVLHPLPRHPKQETLQSARWNPGRHRTTNGSPDWCFVWVNLSTRHPKCSLELGVYSERDFVAKL